MDKDYIIYQEDGLFGAKNQRGEVIIPPQYMEMQSFSCGLSLVRNHQYQYAYIDINNKQVIPFGKYSWCDPQFTCGFSRVMEYHCLEEKNKWGIIDTLGNIVVPLRYDKIWTLKEEYLFSIKAFVDNKEEKLNFHQLDNKVIFDGLTYIYTLSVKAFKELVHCERLYVKAHLNTKQLYFTYGANIGFVSLKGIPKEPVISIVANSSGKIFPLLMEKSDIGKTTLSSAKAISKRTISKTASHKTSFWDYESEKMNDADNWSDPYGDEQAYYGGWSREDVESGFADAYEGDVTARWNND
ncbi:WG repeat-containing protein [Bacteroides caecigallinarum]|uniref:WG repeat-containing protein n=1 Tax=Bacteroides caecigallinarum TaxID=1411144 RepID=UPI00195884CF|nr:WG repeat-containing protein [Bacteroides caecigallinarum]MBM6865070.1 WG repeat-containing protein [Bacteroides caecigallinarum]